MSTTPEPPPAPTSESPRGIPLFTVIAGAAAVMIFLARLTLEDPWSWKALERWGVVDGYQVYDGAWSSLVASCLLHVNWAHLGFNVYWLWYLGRTAERTIGTAKFAVFCVAAGFVSSATELAATGDTGVGLSGVVYAVAGFMWFARPRYRAFWETMTRPIALLFLGWAALCIGLTHFEVMEVANWAHFTGLAFGSLVGTATLPRGRLAWGGGAVVMLLAAVLSLRMAPWSAEWHAVQAQRAVDADELESGMKHASAAIRLDKEYPHPYELRGWIHSELEDYESAIEDLTHAIVIGSGDVYARVLRGYCYRMQERYTEALADQKEALLQDPDYAWAREERGWARIGIGDYEGAIGDFTDVIDAASQPTMWYHAGRGAALRLNDEFDDALVDLNHALRLDPHCAFAYNERGWVHIGLEMYHDAISDFERGIQLDPQEETNFGGRGFCHRQLRDPQQAIADQKRAIAINARYAYAYREIGWIRYDQKQYRPAIRQLNKAIEIDPDEGYALALRGTCYAELGDQEKAVRDLRAAIEKEPDELWIYTQLSNVLYDQEALAEAAAVLERAVARGFADAKSYEWLAWVYMTSEDPKLMNRARAIDHALKATKMEPENARYWSTLACAYFSSSANDASLGALEKALKLDAKRDDLGWILAFVEEWTDEDSTADTLAFVREAVAVVAEHAKDETFRRRFADAADLAGISGR